MSTVGQAEIATQERVLRLFQSTLGYTYLGNWKDRAGNRNVEEDLVRKWLRGRGVGETLISRTLYQLDQAAALGAGTSLYDANRAVYDLLRYGVKVSAGAGEPNETVHLIDWADPEANDFYVAEEVTVEAANTKRPDVVVYVNGIALAVLELKRSTVTVSQGIRQNLDNQKPDFIRRFFTTVQLVLAGNDTEGLRYGTIETPEKYYLGWREENPDARAGTDRGSQAGTERYLPSGTCDGGDGPLDCALLRLMDKARLLEIVHDFVVFDAGVKKVCRHNQYFGVQAAQGFVRSRKGGIIWHTQGSGKSLTMVWLAKWIREHVEDARVLIVTDRTELDEQIEKVFLGVSERIVRTQSGADLLARLNGREDWLLCSLIHKFGAGSPGTSSGASSGNGGRASVRAFIEDLQASLPPGFRAKGTLFVFVDECHRTQSGDLHEAMRAILPAATFFGFTGTPLLAADKKRSIEVFGPYIHTYRFDEAVRDGVVLDLRYEARNVDQHLTSPAKVDRWFEAKTAGLTDVAVGQLKQKWGTMKRVLSSRSRLQMIVSDILLDMATRDRLKSGHGNALLVASSIYQACKYYELFAQTDLAGKCAVVTSYVPSASDIKGEETGEGATEKLHQYAIYRKMLADYFEEDEDRAVGRVEEFEQSVKRTFVHEPGQMKLLIVVDKLLTGFDAPPATYLYIDKTMRDHGLFQAICRVNRLHGEDKEYGYIVDYMDLFQSLEEAIHDYTGGAFEDFDEEDVRGLLKDRLVTARVDLEEAREAVAALCEPVPAPKGTADYLHYFCAEDTADREALKANERRRLSLYKAVASLVRAYAALANEMGQAGYAEAEAAAVKAEVAHYETVRKEVKIASGDYVDMKLYEPAMRHLLDAYIRADESEVVSQFEDLGLVELVVQGGLGALDALPAGLREDEEAMAETIENNVRRVIIDEQAVNPKYYARMSELLDALIQQRRAQAISYKEYLERMADLAAQVARPGATASYPEGLDTSAKRALYDNLGGDADLAQRIDAVVYQTRHEDWRGNLVKERTIKKGIYGVVEDYDLTEEVFEIVKNQPEY